MPNNNYLLTREGKMITVSDDELYHWKYIKREKKNGKWVYYYDESELKKAKDNKTATDKYANAVLGKLSSMKAEGKENSKEYKDTYASYEKYGNKWRNEANQKYFKELERKESGTKVVDLLNKSSRAINNAKSWVSNLFKKKKKST